MGLGVPNRKIHNLINFLLLGDTYDWLNKLIDYPSVFLGPYHRILFHNEKIDPLITLLATGDPKAALAHYIHIKLDKDKKLQQAIKKYETIKKLLELI